MARLSLTSVHTPADPNAVQTRLESSRAACVPVASPVATAGRVQPGRLPAARVARTVYRGPYEGLGGAWGELCDWIEANGHVPREDLWECYVVGPESSHDPAAWRTELNRPLVK
jgi:effector-binding domain-containing protein